MAGKAEKSKYITCRLSPRTEKARYMAEIQKIEAVSQSEFSEGYVLLFAGCF